MKPRRRFDDEPQWPQPREAVPPTLREWAFVVIMLVLALIASLFCHRN